MGDFKSRVAPATPWEAEGRDGNSQSVHLEANPSGVVPINSADEERLADAFGLEETGGGPPAEPEPAPEPAPTPEG